MLKKKGFTLIELVVVLAIISILAMLIVPSLSGYIDSAKKKATVVNGKTIYMSAVHALSDEAAYNSFYTPQSSWTAYEATPEGRVVSTTTTYKGVTSKYSKKVDMKSDLEAEGNYRFTVVARVDGVDHKTGGDWKNPSDITRVFRTWDYSDKRYETFVKTMCADLDMKLGQNNKTGDEFQVKMPYRKREDGGSLPLIRWLVVYRLDDPTRLEVWAGDGYKAENGPAYRVYPNPAPNYR